MLYDAIFLVTCLATLENTTHYGLQQHVTRCSFDMQLGMISRIIGNHCKKKSQVRLPPLYNGCKRREVARQFLEMTCCSQQSTCNFSCNGDTAEVAMKIFIVKH